jgi:hypothetical protein
MNKKLIYIVFTVLLIMPLVILHGKTVFADDEKSGASITVESYLNALIHGDIPRIKAALSPKFMRKMAPTLDSPSYDATLRSLYANAIFRIVHARFSESDRAKVEAELTLGCGQPMNASFILVRGDQGVYLIDEELQ